MPARAAGFCQNARAFGIYCENVFFVAFGRFQIGVACDVDDGIGFKIAHHIGNRFGTVMSSVLESAAIISQCSGFCCLMQRPTCPFAPVSKIRMANP